MNRLFDFFEFIFYVFGQIFYFNNIFVCFCFVMFDMIFYRLHASLATGSPCHVNN